jgi:hypothetical protein
VKKAPVKKAPLATKKNAPNESVSEAEESDVADTPAKPKGRVADSDDENIPVAKGKQKSASEMYQKVSTQPVPS